MEVLNKLLFVENKKNDTKKNDINWIKSVSIGLGISSIIYAGIKSKSKPHPSVPTLKGMNMFLGHAQYFQNNMENLHEALKLIQYYIIL